jgi:hypothetical protein
MYTASTLYSLAPGGSMPVELPPQTGFWQRGSYQGVLTYVTQPGITPVTITSNTFMVAGAAGGAIFPGPVVTATPGNVQVLITCQSPSPCTPASTIAVTLTVSGSGPVFALPNYTDCTYFLFQRETETDTWDNIENCTPGPTTPLKQVRLTPPYSLQETLKPQSGSWETGVYRVVLMYSTQANVPPTCEAASAGIVVAASQETPGTCGAGSCGSGN